jgi:hypothetical protein
MYLFAPLALAVALPLAVTILDHVLEARQERRLAEEGLLPMDRREPSAWARAVADLLRADLRSARGRAHTVVQVTRWRHPPAVGAARVLETAVAAAHRAAAALVWLFTTSRVVTRAGAALARANGMDLWERRRLAGPR